MGTPGHVSGLKGFLAIFGFLVFCLLGPSSFAQDAAPSSQPPQVNELIRLLQDPAVRSWLEEKKNGATTPPATEPEISASADLDKRLGAVREHIGNIIAAVPRIPTEISRAGEVLMGDMRSPGLGRLLLLFVVFVACGLGSEQIFWWASRRTRAWIGSHPMSTVPQRLRMILLRLAFALALVTIFTLGSVGAFLLFVWPPVLREIVLTYLLAIVATRLALVLSHVLLAPNGRDLERPERYRVIPMPTEEARYWHRRLSWFIGYFAFGWATVSLMDNLGFSREVRIAAAYLLGLLLLVIALEAVWRRPHRQGLQEGHLSRTAVSILLSLYGIVLWVLWVAGLWILFWFAVVAVLLPKAIAVGQAGTTHLLRPTEDETLEERRGILEVSLERGFRVILITAAVLWLAHVLNVDFIALTDRDNLLTRFLRGALTSVIILLVADFLWQAIKAVITRKLAQSEGPATDGQDPVHQARMRTLLPIFRNILFFMIAIIAGLTALSALGIEIGPLIAGAGVVGVAVGFGAQTLVKDVISGIFYLLDDAFRVGEYIQSGSYKGTVESFSLRSVKLRHHRGPVYTVPFGQLGAVQNMSRDWVIDKFMVGVTYDTDLELARKLIKKIGQDFAADPEFAPHIIEPLKMQGVETFGDFAIQIRMKMTTKPGEQFVIRRKALARIKQAFDENGIKFAFPMVQVSSSEDAAAAGARYVAESLQPKGEPPAA